MIEHGFSNEVIKDALNQMSQHMNVSEESKKNIDEMIHQAQVEGKKVKHFTVRKTVVLVAACIVVMGTACFAAGKAVSIISTSNNYQAYTSLDNLDKVSDQVGFSAKVPASFSKGYTFAEMNVDNNTELDQEGNKVGTFQELYVEYKMEGMTDISLTETSAIHCEPGRTGDIVRGMDGIQVSYYVDTYKNVPEDYVLTEEDNENAKRKDYFISYGTGAVEVNLVSYINWEKEGIHYSIMSFDTTLTPDEMFTMAEELIQ